MKPSLTPFFAATFITAAFILSPAVGFAETVESIVKTHESAKAAALEKYIEANPEAEDLGDANNALLMAYAASGQVEKQGAMYEKKYATMEKGADASMREVALDFIQPYMAFLAESGQKDKAAEMADKIKADFKDHEESMALNQFLEGMLAEFKVPKVGDVLEISGTDRDGNMVDLAEMKGKVVLVDFWATWCGPCVAELPNLKKAYEQYNAEGFEVIAISLDKDESSLERFVKQRKLPWPQLFDGKGWDTPLVVKYGITGIPATFLIGKDGKVVDTNLHGPALGKAIAKALK